MPERLCRDLAAGMSESELRTAAKNIGGEVFFAVQGYPFSSFGRFLDDGAPQLPPLLSNGTAPEIEKISWDLFWDVRVFGSGGDWHAWKDSTGWHCGLLRFADGDPIIERDYLLWGEEVETHGEWLCRIEKRGARVWVPAQYAEFQNVSLSTRQLVGFDGASGIAGVIDVAFVGFKEMQHER